jgi:DNA-binding winged helix-turn-helix (wHTH) protein/tetratricopeptide (TPR) repeat protein
MTPTPVPLALRFGPFTVDVPAGKLYKGGTRLRLQEKSFRVLLTLIERRGDVVTREELQERLWPKDTFVDFEDGLHTAVKKLRDALADDAENPRYIETIRGRGYRFLVLVETAPADLRRPGSELRPSSVFPPAYSDTAAPSPNLSAGSSNPEEVKQRTPLLRGVWWALTALVAILAVTAYWLVRSRPVFSFRSRDTVLVTDFENQTGDRRFDDALGTAFTVSVEQSRYANLFPRTRLESVLTRMGKKKDERITPSVGREICAREGIRVLVAMSITRTGQEYALTAQLIDPQTGETARSYTEHSYGEDHILDGLDVLAKETREALGESLYQIHKANKPLPQVTTPSLNALQQYSEAVTLWGNGKYQDAATLFKAAIASDPDFAMAHAGLGRAYYSFIFNQQDDGQKEYEKALSLLSRTTEREHMIIEARYATDRQHWDDASELMRTYLSRYPDDTTMRFNYGNLLRSRNRYREAIEQYKEVLRLAPDFGHAYIGIATADKALEDLPAALQAYEKAFEIDPHWQVAGNINREYGFALVSNGQDQIAEQVFSALLDNPQTRESGLRSLAFLDLYRGHYSKAEERLRQSLEILKAQSSPLSEARVYLLLAVIAEGRGDAKTQRKRLDEANAFMNNIQAKVVFGGLLGDAYARAGVVDEAEKIANIIRTVVDQNSQEQVGYLNLLEGEIALAKGNAQKAIELLTLSNSGNATGLSAEALAHAYQQSGRVDDAVQSYEQMLQKPTRCMGWEPQQQCLEARYTLAQDYLAQGNRVKAQATLAPLLALWEGADKDLPLKKKIMEFRKESLQ